MDHPCTERLVLAFELVLCELAWLEGKNNKMMLLLTWCVVSFGLASFFMSEVYFGYPKV